MMLRWSASRWPCDWSRASVVWAALLALTSHMDRGSVRHGARLAGAQLTDVCTQEEYSKYKSLFCPDTFFVSSLAFNPHGPGLESNITVIVQSSTSMESSATTKQYLDMMLPQFSPTGSVSAEDANARLVAVSSANPVGDDEEPEKAYNSPMNPVFDKVGNFDTTTNTVRLRISEGKSMLAKDTEFTMCCFMLPMSMPMDWPTLGISAPTSQASRIKIASQPIKSTPLIDRGNYWEHLQIEFEPPLSMYATVISAVVQPANDLKDRARIIIYVPTVTRVGEDGGEGETGDLSFNTKGSDWMLFEHKAKWDKEQSSMTFFLREGVMLEKGRQITLRTAPGEFRLPVEVEANWAKFQVEARSQDNVDEIIEKTSVFQSTRVPHVRKFVTSELQYTRTEAYAVADVTLIFRTNRPMFSNTMIMLRLAGFASEVVEVQLLGENAVYFFNKIALFDLPKNELTLRLNQTLYSDEKATPVTLHKLHFPHSLYPNDPSLLIWNSDPLAEKQSIMTSPAVGSGQKMFNRSQVVFQPNVPEMAANVTFTLLPSVTFYQDDKILLHLYGFKCSKSLIPLEGPDTARIAGSRGHWNRHNSVLTLIVAKEMIVSNEFAMVFTINLNVGFRLPGKLSENDGILMIEGQGPNGVSLIVKEAMKKTPQIGDRKYITYSSLTFEPMVKGEELSRAITKVMFRFVVNSDILPNSTIYFKLGGLKREPTADPTVVLLSGMNAPLFTDSKGHWDAGTNILRVTIVPNSQITAGKDTRFFIEYDQRFRLPYAMYPNDPSLYMYIPEGGIHNSTFNFTTRVNREAKAFVTSELLYGEKETEVPFPLKVTTVSIRFMPNVELPQGSVISVRLPGFQCPLSTIQLEPYKLYDRTYENFVTKDNKHVAKWDQNTFTLSLEVAPGKTVPSDAVTNLKMTEADVGFRLPKELRENDPGLMIACTLNQIIDWEPIKVSPRVVARTFQVSNFHYTPREKKSTFLFTIELQPTVNITFKTPIDIKLVDFQNVLFKEHIHLTGKDANQFQLKKDQGKILDSTGDWNETDTMLTLRVAENKPIPAFQMIELMIEEAQGFILPRTLYANDPKLEIRARLNILWEQVKSSPMIGDGPNEGQRFCIYQYERGTRTQDPLTGDNCDPPIADPCSAAELRRCDAMELSEVLLPITILGFQLMLEDELGFIPIDQQCTKNFESLPSFSMPQKVVRSLNRDYLEFHNISSIQTGYFRICFRHYAGTRGTAGATSEVFDVGSVTVRPSCPSPLVMVEGTCVEHCPTAKVPVAGECQRDPVATMAVEKQAIMVSLKMHHPSAIRNHIYNRSADDPERRYFEYRYTYELARILDANPDRFKVSSISNGSVIVNTVFTTVVEDNPAESATARSPKGLLELLRALQADKNSKLYESSFFRYIEPTYQPQETPVQMCPDGKYRTMCPYMDTVIPQSGGMIIFALSVLGTTLVIVLLCVGAWRIDFDTVQRRDDDFYKRAAHDPHALDPSMQAEYAQSWLEGRFMGENWDKHRKAATFLALD